MTTTTEALKMARDALAGLISACKQAKVDLTVGIRDGDPVHPVSAALTWPLATAINTIAAIDALPASVPSGEPAPTRADLIAALQFYAAGQHRITVDDAAWDTVSGEPSHWLGNEAGDMVEDGTIAAQVLAGGLTAEDLADDGDDGAPTAQAPLPAALLVRDIANDLKVPALDVCSALQRLGYGHHSVNMAITADMARDLTRHLGTAPLMANGLTRDETAATASVAGLAEPQKRPAWLDDPGPPTAEQLEAYRRASAAPQAAPVPAPSDDGEHPAARRIRESFEQKYKDLAGVMRTILAWRHAWAEYQRPYNRDMQEPVTEDQVDQAERGMLTAIRGYAAARTSATAAGAGGVGRAERCSSPDAVGGPVERSVRFHRV